jgi:light-regulated signal transduction histidine kinase (bacteriophytochrome)
VLLDITARTKQEQKILATQEELKILLDQAEQSRRVLLTIVEDQKLAQEEIQSLNKTLEDRVINRTSQLKSSNEELESFAYSISHDLRAPLRAIDGYSRILEQDYAKVLDEEGIRLLKIVRNSTKNMDDLITDLLSLSRVGRSELILERLDMNALVDSTIKELVTPEIENKVTIIVKNIPNTNGDSSLIRHVWINLISNAIKYSLPKEKPVIIISGINHKNECTYTIKDNGVGFNPKYKDKLFGLFQRLHKASEFEGTGVGLAIVQRIVHRHGGQVWGDSQLGEGAEFSFTIPKRKVNSD